MYLRLLIFLPAILIPACASSSPAFHMIYSAYKLNKQDDNIQPWCTPFPNLEAVCCSLFGSNRCFLSWIQISQEAGKMVWYSQLFKNFPVCCDTHSKRGYFSLTLLLFLWSNKVGNLISGSSDFSKCSLNVWKFLVHVLLKPRLENFEHYFTSMWEECNCILVVWTFFGIAFLWDWNGNWPFPILWPPLSFPNLLAYWVQHFHSTIF